MQKQIEETLAFPLSIYDYTIDGTNNVQSKIENQKELDVIYKYIVKKALDEKRKIVINDRKEVNIFCAEGGKVIFRLE